MRVLAAILLLAIGASAQQPQLTEAESLKIKNSLLQQQLSRAQAKMFDLEQKILVMEIKASHGWGQDVQIRLNDQGVPEAAEAKKDNKPTK